MTKGNNTKTILIIVAVILGIMLIGGIIIGFGFYSLYRIGTKEVTPTASPSVSVAVTRDLTGYSNARYGFSFNYPKVFMAAESQNSDGVTLTTNDPPMTIRAYGSMNALSQNLGEYLNESRKNLFQEQGNGEEILAEDTTLDGIPAQERQWTYTNSVDGSKTLMDQVTTLKGDAFYTIQMIVGYTDADEYPTHVFDGILESYQFN